MVTVAASDMAIPSLTWNVNVSVPLKIGRRRVPDRWCGAGQRAVLRCGHGERERSDIGVGIRSAEQDLDRSILARRHRLILSDRRLVALHREMNGAFRPVLSPVTCDNRERVLAVGFDRHPARKGQAIEMRLSAREVRVGDADHRRDGGPVNTAIVHAGDRHYRSGDIDHELTADRVRILARRAVVVARAVARPHAEYV
jgi:hypothetical protein